MTDLSLKIYELKNLLDFIDDDDYPDIKRALFHVIDDINLLQDSEIQSDNAWETAMLALVGTDGIGGVKRIFMKVIETLESIEKLSPDMAANLAPLMAKDTLELINDEKALSRDEKPVHHQRAPDNMVIYRKF